MKHFFILDIISVYSILREQRLFDHVNALNFWASLIYAFIKFLIFNNPLNIFLVQVFSFKVQKPKIHRKLCLGRCTNYLWSLLLLVNLTLKFFLTLQATFLWCRKLQIGLLTQVVQPVGLKILCSILFWMLQNKKRHLWDLLVSREVRFKRVRFKIVKIIVEIWSIYPISKGEKINSWSV